MKNNHLILLACITIAGIITLLVIKNSELLADRLNIAENNEGKEDKKEKRAQIKDLQTYFNGIHNPFGQKKSPAPAGYLMKEYMKVKNATGKLKAAAGDIEWIQRGPVNVGGRTRGLIVDPDDPTHQTWYAGSATGGLWKTADAGVNWECLSNDIPYQATTTLAMSKSNSQVIYMGTGESFDGSMYTTGGGVFKSTDKGVSWVQLTSTEGNEDFRYINRIEVDPENEDIVLVATTTGIFKSIDGGDTWSQTYSTDYTVDDLVADSGNFNYVFAGVKSFGILRSVNAGDTWENITNGLAGGYSRIELAISPSNPQKIYASVATSDDGVSDLYSSWNRGNNWQKVVNSGGTVYNFLGGQGDYDNTLAVHPYDENTVYWGGVNLWKVALTSTTQEGDGTVTAFNKINTESFLDFIPFTGNLFPGMNTGDHEDAISLVESDFVSVEIRFGPGMSQKAHRFYVPSGATSGVPYTSYTYQDYIDVPFEVWDITNNRQLMCSFRDQERDGEFNLYERTGEDYGELGREYLFINAVPYNATTPDPNIAATGGRSYKLIYFFWPTLAEGGTWNPNSLPDSKIAVDWIIIQERLGAVTNVSDAYNSYSGNNTYDQSAGLNTTSIPGLHPDHHELVMIPVDDATEDFWILNANDGGMGISYDKGVTFTQIKQNFITTQFYGVAKKPYRNEYIGGMQDNGTWQSPINVDASLDTGFYFRIGGDGFETVWNNQDSNRIMGSVYYNSIRRSINHGRNWEDASDGITTDDGPFITRLTPVPSKNNIVFAISSSGVYKTGNFATTKWKLISIGAGWIATGYSNFWNQVKVSPANEQIVWAGAGMYPSISLTLFVSIDQGDYFTAVSQPSNPVPAFCAGIATHPTDENTAYVLYSLYGYPKILRTTDLGESWEDITQVGEKGISANGFPNVGCLSLLVFPDNPDRIWAGTEIGIMESLDNGDTWHYLESELPSVAIWQLFMQDNQVVVATYGRGIWTYQYGNPVAVENHDLLVKSLSVFPNPTAGIVNIELPEIVTSGNCNIKVYNMDGKVVYIAGADNFAGSKITLDLTSLKTGTYLISVASEDMNYTTRIIKQ